MSTSEASEGVFGERLRLAREARKLSQTDLGKLAGLQSAAIGHFEKGRRKPSFANIRALAKALGVTSDYLLGEADGFAAATTAFRNEDKLSASDREAIQTMIDMFNQRRGQAE